MRGSLALMINSVNVSYEGNVDRLGMYDTCIFKVQWEYMKPG